jgi:hypothetical protein
MHFPHQIAAPVTPLWEMDVVPPCDGSHIGTVDMVGTEGVGVAVLAVVAAIV